YADWLEEQGDPRGHYLRMEMEALRASPRLSASNVRRLRAAGQGLDAVWVARVSRPPVGVYCDHPNLGRGKPQQRPWDLDQIERELAVSFPPAYRAFLLNYNGYLADASHYTDAGDARFLPSPDYSWGPRFWFFPALPRSETNWSTSWRLWV